MRRGDVVWVDLDQVVGTEVSKRRPAVIVSSDGANSTTARLRRGLVTVVPVTTNVARVYPFQVLPPADRCGLPRDSKAHAEQIRSVAFERVGRVVGRLPHDLVAELDRAIRLHLAL